MMQNPRRAEASSAMHRPVMLREVIDYLDLKPGQTVLDGTVGGGGHSRPIWEHIGPTGTLIGMDRDPAMLAASAAILNETNSYLRQGSYADCGRVLEERDIAGVDRILLDLGFSSDQLADAARGFSFETDGPLDLRYDTSEGTPAWKLLDQCPQAKIADILQEFGEERFSDAIAERIVQHRPIRTTGELVRVVREAVPQAFQRKARRHPATRTFQALRIAVNQELAHLKSALDEGLPRGLVPGGRLVILTYHSLEDRLIKHAFQGDARWQNLTPKPVTPRTSEQKLNPRSRTAKLRAAVKK